MASLYIYSLHIGRYSAGLGLPRFRIQIWARVVVQCALTRHTGLSQVTPNWEVGRGS